jgi:hypothetical protein
MDGTEDLFVEASLFGVQGFDGGRGAQLQAFRRIAAHLSFASGDLGDDLAAKGQQFLEICARCRWQRGGRGFLESGVTCKNLRVDLVGLGELPGAGGEGPDAGRVDDGRMDIAADQCSEQGLFVSAGGLHDDAGDVEV